VEPTPAEAAELACELLSGLGDRWRHTKAVAARAGQLSSAVAQSDQNLLVVAAWWHDLGYSPELRYTGLHQADGARYLRAHGYPERLCALIAHHSAATFEAVERDLSRVLDDWPREESPVSDALWMADMTTGPRGEVLSYEDRFHEIIERYTPDSVVARAMTRARPQIEAAISRTVARLAG
jgi:putative nucleotidyltransferase with HDIG domain